MTAGRVRAAALANAGNCAGKKPTPRRLLPIGDTDGLTKEQLQRVKLYAIASRLIPSGNRTARNVQVLTEYLSGEDTRVAAPKQRRDTP